MFRESADTVTHELTRRRVRSKFTARKSESREYSIWHSRNYGVACVPYRRA